MAAVASAASHASASSSAIAGAATGTELPSKKQIVLFLRILVGLTTRAATSIRDDGSPSRSDFYARFEERVADLESQAAEAAGIAGVQAAQGIRAYSGDKSVAVLCTKLQRAREFVVRTPPAASGLANPPSAEKKQLVLRFFELSETMVSDALESLGDSADRRVTMAALGSAAEQASVVFAESEGVSAEELARLKNFFARDAEVAAATERLQSMIRRAFERFGGVGSAPTSDESDTEMTEELAMQVIKGHSAGLVRLVMQLGNMMQGHGVPSADAEAAVMAIFSEHRETLFERACAEAGCSPALLHRATECAARFPAILTLVEERGPAVLQAAVKLAARILRDECGPEEAMAAEAMTVADITM